jgi:hypothetical protein
LEGFKENKINIKMFLLQTVFPFPPAFDVRVVPAAPPVSRPLFPQIALLTSLAPVVLATPGMTMQS